MFDLSSNFTFHLRLTCSKPESFKLMTEFIKHFKPKKVVSCHEVSSSGVEHSHSHIEGDETFFNYHTASKGTTARSAFFKKHNMAGLFNFYKTKTTPKQNICYVVKDNDYILTQNITDDEVEELRQWTAEINKSKKMDTRDKLLQAFEEAYKDVPEFIYTVKNEFIFDMDDLPLPKECYDVVFNQGRPHELDEIAEWIHWHFIDKWNKPPPTMHMREYVLWIASKTCSMDTKNYYGKLFPR